ncbi:MAG: hypothetical protein KAT32_04455 [Candidatus Moranbacteria bacterium]|nr:hypothetical protein [Candidatus Moranbacteria bacterium]
MKITKEKVVYFLSLNLVPYLFVIPYYLLILGLNHPKTIFGFHYIIFFASTIAFIYSFYKKNNYNIFMSALFSSVPALFFIIFLIIYSDIACYTINDILAITYVLTISLPLLFILSLIILAVTNPLRKKIKW